MELTLHFRLFFLLIAGLLPISLRAQSIPVRVHLDTQWAADSTWLLATPGGTSTDSVSFGLLKPQLVSELPNGVFQMNQGFSGRIYIFVNTGKTQIPTQASQIASDTSLHVRYDFIEATYFGSPYDCADLSSVDQFGLGLSMVSTDTSGNRISSVGYNTNAYGLIHTVSQIVNDSIYPAIFYHDNAFMRIISPLHTTSGTYTNMESYVNALCNASDTLVIFDSYSGATAKYTIDTNSYNHVYDAIPFCYQAILSPTADSIYLVPHPNIAQPSKFLQGTIAINKADLYNTAYNMIYACDGPFYVQPSGLVPILGDTLPDKVGFNDPWSTVVRNFLAGFNAGYYGQTDTIYEADTTWLMNGNNSWTWNPLFAFEQKNAYNAYAKAVMNHSDSYGFPFSDFIAKPLLNLHGIDSLILNVWNDSTAYTGDYVPTFQKLTADTVNPAGPNVSGNLTLNFGCGDSLGYNGAVEFYGNSYTCGWTYTALDTAHQNSNTVSCVNFTVFPGVAGLNNKYTFTVEGTPFGFTVAIDSTGTFTSVAVDNPTITVTLGPNNSITLSNLQYAIPPDYIFDTPGGSTTAMKHSGRKSRRKK
jgi:hypothetical protein